jgi:hypothetical protein
VGGQKDFQLTNEKLVRHSSAALVLPYSAGLTAEEPSKGRWLLFLPFESLGNLRISSAQKLNVADRVLADNRTRDGRAPHSSPGIRSFPSTSTSTPTAGKR